eukprot:scaffold19445_cov62-Phaeocystis_antarctica.AAC.3
MHAVAREPCGELLLYYCSTGPFSTGPYSRFSCVPVHSCPQRRKTSWQLQGPPECAARLASPRMTWISSRRAPLRG